MSKSAPARPLLGVVSSCQSTTPIKEAQGATLKRTGWEGGAPTPATPVLTDAVLKCLGDLVLKLLQSSHYSEARQPRGSLAPVSHPSAFQGPSPHFHAVCRDLIWSVPS